MSNYGIPFNMAPAPVRKKQVTPVDLGKYDPNYAGWEIVINPRIPRSAYTMALSMANEDATTQEKWDAMGAYLHLVLLAWNFMDEDPVTGEVRGPLPQPGDGGIEVCEQEVYPAIFKAIADHLKPPNT